jgi:serine phosphatase RsbU (regulator of sigma subunit)
MSSKAYYDDETPTPPPFYVYPTKSEPRSRSSEQRPSKPPRTIRILLIEDNPGDARLIREALFEAPTTAFDLQRADRLLTGLKILEQGNTDLILLDLSLPESWGINTLLKVREAAPTVPVVVLTGLDDETTAVTAVQEGAQDYLVKGHVTGSLLVRSVRYAIERGRRRQAERALRATKEEFRIAQEIQQKLFPASAPALSGLDIGGAAFPAEATGGDYFDYIHMLDGSWGIVVGDVAGHGFGPALLMAEARAYLRALAWTHSDVCEILTLANRLLAEDVGDDHFVTLFFGRLDPRERSFEYSSAGHPDGFVLNAAGEIKRRLQSTGYPLGVERETTYTAGPSVSLDPGDLVFLLTDGVFESRFRDEHPYGIERALETIRDCRHLPAQRIIESLYDSICDFCRLTKPTDDITAVIIKVLTGA